MVRWCGGSCRGDVVTEMVMATRVMVAVVRCGGSEGEEVVEMTMGLIYHDLYLDGKALKQRENVSFDLTKSDLSPSFVEDLIAKGVGLHVVDSHIGTHREDGFMPLETIRRFLDQRTLVGGDKGDEVRVLMMEMMMYGGGCGDDEGDGGSEVVDVVVVHGCSWRLEESPEVWPEKVGAPEILMREKCVCV
ncbi:hypothetical protein Tco_0547746 [Tanacetum coccineum]